MTSTRFDVDTAVTRRAEGFYDAQISSRWWIVRGPNGGYLAAMLANAIEDTAGDPACPLRSITIHYLRPPVEGPATIETTLERSGRTVKSVTARMMQGGKLQAIAIAAHASPRDSGGFEHARMPEVLPPERCPARRSQDSLAIHDHFEMRTAIGPATRDAERTEAAMTGGWIRFAESAPWTPARIGLVADAWPPAVFSARATPPSTQGVPTIDLTVHVLAPDRIASLAPDAFVFVRFETQVLRGGYLEEDGEIWSPEGHLLARARQVAVML